MGTFISRGLWATWSVVGKLIGALDHSSVKSSTVLKRQVKDSRGQQGRFPPILSACIVNSPPSVTQKRHFTFLIPQFYRDDPEFCAAPQQDLSSVWYITHLRSPEIWVWEGNLHIIHHILTEQCNERLNTACEGVYSHHQSPFCRLEHVEQTVDANLPQTGLKFRQKQLKNWSLASNHCFDLNVRDQI